MKKVETLIKNYIAFEMKEGRAPNSVFEFCKANKMDEKDFYAHFNNFSQLRKEILISIIVDVFETIDNDENYEAFSPKEKVLAVFYTLFEEFKSIRSYLLFRYDNKENWKYFSSDWEGFFRQLSARMEQLIIEAKSHNEIKDRPFIGNHYAKGLKLLFVYVFRVWVKDESKEFQNTDAAIEKSVNLFYDLLGQGPLDALIDFGKFAMKTKVI